VRPRTRPEQLARLGPVLLFARGQLPESLVDDPPELAPREREEVRDLCLRDRVVARELRVRRPILGIEVVAPEQPEVNVPPAPLALAAQPLDRDREDAPHPLAVERLLDGGGGASNGELRELLVDAAPVERREPDGSAPLDPRRGLL